MNLLGACLVLLFLIQDVTGLEANTFQQNDDETRSLRGGYYSSRGSYSGSSSYSNNRSYYNNNNNNNNSNNYHSSSTNSNSNSNTNTNSNANRNRNGGGTRSGGGMSRLARGVLFTGLGLAVLAMLFPLVMGGCCTACIAGLCCGLGAVGVAGAANATNKPNEQQQQHSAASYPPHNPQQSSFGGDYYPAPDNNSNGKTTTTTTTNNNNNKMGPSSFSAEFEDCARRAKQEVESNGAYVTRQQQTSKPYSGYYQTSYVDRTTSVQHNTRLNLNFTPDFHGRGYKLSGDGHDIDGNSVIEDGHVNLDGTAWWKERTISGDVGLKVLSRGTFDFSLHIFQGTWLASSMEHGSYITFQQALEEVPNNYISPSGNPSTGVVVATHVTPQPSAPPTSSTTAAAAATPTVVSATHVSSSHVPYNNIPMVTATAYVAPSSNNNPPTVYVPPH